ncbi:hypothetical protein FB45DRAFT_893428 [Roridomyces roridus]|uniref:RNA polymerase II elongation factor ELL N-terminal domain-containing protein n=1 Tax=Roridomyces roridus TaxID=1738132 RepID=A0AAD7G0K8_9AGAR|nr:hypothetical protein FB45DRAFT_893428 [Roridomyces roridus]
MSLPTGAKLSVQGHTAHSLPKQAMIVRMTAESLDALHNSPHIQFSFGNESGIHIGDTFFPMRPLKENSPHDLYLRASSASKPMAPLKLYANITGKFTVERDLRDIEDSIRSATLDAKKVKEGRTITVLETLPDIPSTQSKKRKKDPVKSSMFTKPITQPRPAATAARAPSPSLSPLRTAVIKVLAVKEALAVKEPLAAKETSVDELLRLVPSEHDMERARRKLLALLSQLAEQPNPSKAPTLWRLKPATWVEVRPYEWADLSEQEKTAVARTARLTFSNLNIPETDAVWAHVIYRKGIETPMVASSSRASGEVPKRGVSSKEAKEKKAKPKPDPKAEIQMRDESKPAPRKGKEVEDGPSPSATGPARKGPGSGFRISKVSSPDISNPPTPPVPATTSSSRGGPRDVRTNREPPRASLPARPAPPIAPPVQEKKAPPRVKKVKDATPVAERERERAPEMKRKKLSADMPDEDVLPSSKRRKTEGMVPGAAARDLSLPRKPEAHSLPVKAIKKEPSPLPPPTRQPQKSRNEPPAGRSSLAGRSGDTHMVAKSSSQSQRSNSSGSKRRERPSPVYTSSEDESQVRRDPAPQTATVHRSRPQASSSVKPLPTDRNGLRTRYNKTYLKYLQSYHQLYAQQTKLESLLNGRDGSTISDSDGDVEVLSPEETVKLKADHKRWERELESIRDIFMGPERSDSKSD